MNSLIFSARSRATRLAIGAGLVAATLLSAGCATTAGGSIPRPTPMTAAEVAADLKAGVTKQDILAKAKTRGVQPVNAASVDTLKQAGADNDFIDTLMGLALQTTAMSQPRVYFAPMLALGYPYAYPSWYWGGYWGGYLGGWWGPDYPYWGVGIRIGGPSYYYRNYPVRVRRK